MTYVGYAHVDAVTAISNTPARIILYANPQQAYATASLYHTMTICCTAWHDSLLLPRVCCVYCLYIQLRAVQLHCTAVLLQCSTAHHVGARHAAMRTFRAAAAASQLWQHVYRLAGMLFCSNLK
jgi:hypothetical protein